MQNLALGTDNVDELQVELQCGKSLQDDQYNEGL
jgi:hypothetical protein